MKRCVCAVTLLVLGAFLHADDSRDYYFFGENRANLPGPEILSSVYTENPAAIADAIRNSVSFRLLGLFGREAATMGMGYTLSIPSFTVFGITETVVGTSTDILGVQFGVSSRSFLPDLPAEAAAGLSILRAGRVTPSGTDASFRFDLGITASFASLRMEALVKNALRIAASGFSAFGPGAEYGLTVGGKLILDIDCILGAAYSPGMASSPTEGVELAGSLKFIRYFFDNSLRAGIELVGYADFDSPSNLLPVVEYGMAVSYVMPDFFAAKRTGTDGFADILASALSFLRNLSIDGSALFLVNNFPGREGLRVNAGIGLTKFY